MSKSEEAPIKAIATNRKASHEFHIHDKYEAGIVLMGSEVKSLRDSKVTIVDGWVELKSGEAWLHGIQINEYKFASQFGHEAKRVRKLLLNKNEINKLFGKTQLRGFTVIPLRLYFKGARVKVEIALVTNKQLHDKRDAKRTADVKRELAQDLKDRY